MICMRDLEYENEQKAKGKNLKFRGRRRIIKVNERAMDMGGREM